MSKKLKIKLLIAAFIIFIIAVSLFGIILARISNSSIVQTDKAFEAPIHEQLPTVTPIIQENMSAAGAYIIGGDEVYSYRADKRWPIASITKLMTSLVAANVFKPDDVITITEPMVDTEGISGGLKVGDRYTVGDLTEAMLLVSSNDAAEALAMGYGEEKFIDKMNALAKEIGMTDTLFVDPTGLSIQNLSTVEDLRSLATYIWENNPHIFSITTREKGTILDIKSGKRHKLANINEFAGRDDFLGGKTGHIPEADGNLLSLFTVPGRASPVIIVVLGASNDRFLETEKILEKL